MFNIGGNTSTAVQTIDFFNISTTGNATNFGNLGDPKSGGTAGSSATRSIYAGGNTAGVFSVTTGGRYFTNATSGSGLTYGTLTSARAFIGQSSNDTRLVSAGGYDGSQTVDTTDYYTISTTSNAAGWGAATSNHYNKGGGGNSTYGYFWGGWTSGSGRTANIQYVTMATTGTVASFGNLTTASEAGSNGMTSSSTRLLMAQGNQTQPYMYYITMGTSGSVSLFGDVTGNVGNTNFWGTSNKTRAVFAGSGGTTSAVYFTIASTGNSTDFGNLTSARSSAGGTGTSHGGLA
jgi:hypothetical protein